MWKMQRHIEQDKNLKRSAGSQIGKGRDVGCGTLWSFVTSCGVLWSIVASCGVLWHLACPNNRSACRLAAGLVTPKVLTAKQVFYLKMVPSICLRLSDLSNHIVMNSVPI